MGKPAIPAASPNVTIVKSVTSVGGVSGTPAATCAGQVIDYQVVITNTGNQTLTDVLVTDATLSTTLASLASLAAGTTLTYTAKQKVIQANIDGGGAITNTAVVTSAQTPSRRSTVTTSVSQSPGMSIKNSVISVGGIFGNPAVTEAGEVIDYQIEVTNSGNTTLTNVLVTDPAGGGTLSPAASLPVSGSVTYPTSQTVTQAQIDSGQAITNTAVVTSAQTPSQTSTVTTPVSQVHGASIVKSVTSVGGGAGNRAATSAGEIIKYEIVVTNTGNQTLTNVLVTDPTLGLTLATLASLAVAASATYTASRTVDLDALSIGRPIANTAVVTASQMPSRSSTVTTPVSRLAVPLSRLTELAVEIDAAKGAATDPRIAEQWGFVAGTAQAFIQELEDQQTEAEEAAEDQSATPKRGDRK